PLHLVGPAIAIVVAPATHFSAPECEKEKGESDRPPDDEAEDRHGNPAGMPWRIEHARAVVLFPLGGRAAPAIHICGVRHFPSPSRHPAVVNVNNIYINSPTIGFVKRAAGPVRQLIFGILFRAAPRA